MQSVQNAGFILAPDPAPTAADGVWCPLSFHNPHDMSSLFWPTEGVDPPLAQLSHITGRILPLLNSDSTWEEFFKYAGRHIHEQSTMFHWNI